MTKNGSFRSVVTTAIAVCLFAFLASCGGGGDSGSAAGKTGSITLTADPASIPADGSSASAITATITDSAGNPVRHYTDVTFSTTLGRFRNGSTSYTVQTQPPLDDKGWPDPKADPTGIAVVSLISAYTSGAAKVTVQSNNVTQTVYVSFTGAGAVIKLEADPASIPADGKSSSTIKATLTDSTGGPVKPGTSVTFTTGLGHLVGGGKSYTVTTPDDTGTVQVSLLAGVVPGTTYVVATSNDVSQAISIVLTNMYASKMSIKAVPKSIPADGVSTSLVTATVKNVAGTPIPEVPVTFYDANVPTESASLPDDNTWKGTTSNDHVTPDFYCYSGSVSFTMTYSGSQISNFAVRLWNRDTMKVFVLMNTTGPVTEEKVSKTVGAGNYYFQVTADGQWEIKVEGSIGPAQAGTPKVLAVTRTDSNGNAEYTYTSTLTVGVVKIKAETGELSVTESTEALTQTVEIIQTAGAPAKIELTAIPSQIYANGATTSTVTATVSDAHGNPVEDGTIVTFSATLGDIKDTTAKTVDGIASTILTSVSSASTLTSTITGLVNGISGSTSVIFLGTGGVFLTNMSADPSVILANGTSTSTISVRLQDASGVGIANQTITFTTTKGTLQSSQATTDATGLATTTLISATTSGTATVTAKYGAITANTTVNFTGGGGAVASITVTATPSTLPANGTSTSDIRAEVKNIQGDPVADGEVISFTITSGTGTLSASSAPTVGGFATITYTASKTPGTVTIQAMAANFVFGTTTITLISGGVGSITLVAEPASIPADGSSSSVITATVKDASGNPVPAGTTVTFSTTLGSLSSTSVTTFDDTGIVTVSLISGTKPGTATVTAQAIGVTQTVYVTFTGGEVAKIELTADPATLSADGISTSTITATVKTSDNQLIPGAEVVFSTTRGSITSRQITNDQGQAVATLTSEKFNDPSVVVKATSQGVEATVLVSFSGVVLTLEASSSGLLIGEASMITATLKDGAGNPISNTSITFSTDKGSLDPATPQITNSLGQATVKLTSNISGTATVTATGRGATGKVTVEYTSYLFRFLDPNPGTIRVQGETSQLTTELLDNGVPRSGQLVFFSSTLGTLNPYNATTGTDGKASTVLTSGTQSGVAVVNAEVTVDGTHLAAATQVVITGGDAEKIVLTADPGTIAIDIGVSTITATVVDPNDQPAVGQEIYFRINAGPGGGEYLSASVKTTNTYGVATVFFYAGSLASTLDGVGIEANTRPDFGGSYGLVDLTIAGPVANIGIGMNLETLEPAGGSLKIDIAGIATDVNGNPVADGTKIHFSVTAIEFDEDRANDHRIDCWDDIKHRLIPCPPVGTPGFGFTWFSDDVNQDGTMYSLGGPMSTTEDVNHNGILDPGEDKNDNGVIDPVQGCTIDASVDTENGVAETTLIYPAPQANNIKVRITAEAGGVSNFYDTILLCTLTMVEQGTCGINY